MFKSYVLPKILIPVLIFLFVSTTAFAGISEQERRLRALEKKAESQSELLQILQRFTWGGDLRLRYQFDHRDLAGSNTVDRDRFRVRFRLGASVHMYKDLDIGFRLGTGGLNAQTSGNQTFDNGFGDKVFDLQRAYFKWSPDNFTFIGGKFGVPFMRSQLIWDSDVNVEGVSEQFTHRMGDTHFKIILGQFIIDEFNPGDDIKLLAYQGVVEQKTRLGTFKAALAYYDYLEHEDPATAPSNSVSNNTLSEVKVLDVMGEWSEKIYSRKFTLFGEYAKNTGSLALGQPDLDTAWHIGAKYGKAGKRFGDWSLALMYRVVQTEAVLDVLADSNFHAGLNNFRGYMVGGGIGLRKGVNLDFTYYDTEEERGASDEKEVFYADIVFKF